MKTHYTPRKRSLVGILVSPCLSVCLFPVCGHAVVHACFEIWVHGFFPENWYIEYSTSEHVHLELSYWLDNFSLLYRLFCFRTVTWKTCSVLKLWRTLILTLKMWCCWNETLYLLLWFTMFLKKGCANFHFHLHSLN